MRTIAALIAGLLLLAACTGEPDVREPDPTPSASASPTSAPPMPSSQVAEDSPEGATAFVDFWLKASNHSALTGDTDLLENISADECQGCRRYIDLYEQIYEAGGALRGGERTISETTVDYSATGESFVEANVNAAKGQEQQRDDSEVKETPANTVDLTFEIERAESGWILGEIALIEED
ncbi:DUF6318 family protein [Aeromicrobium sp. CF4.19]|uniref:DUF6318 family protein n=1 Tax=Aeromicrobium sp. CF4.19 TaxID=3373082 RepID=UPI003EE6BDBC